MRLVHYHALAGEEYGLVDRGECQSPFSQTRWKLTEHAVKVLDGASLQIKMTRSSLRDREMIPFPGLNPVGPVEKSVTGR